MKPTKKTLLYCVRSPKHLNKNFMELYRHYFVNHVIRFIFFSKKIVSYSFWNLKNKIPTKTKFQFSYTDLYHCKWLRAVFFKKNSFP